MCYFPDLRPGWGIGGQSVYLFFLVTSRFMWSYLYYGLALDGLQMVTPLYTNPTLYQHDVYVPTNLSINVCRIPGIFRNCITCSKHIIDKLAHRTATVVIDTRTCAWYVSMYSQKYVPYEEFRLKYGGGQKRAASLTTTRVPSTTRLFSLL